MIETFNFTNTKEELDNFGSLENMKKFAKEHGCNGIELQMFENVNESYLKEDENFIQGIHLKVWNNWMDLWMENEEGLLKEFGSLEVVKQYYGGLGKQTIIDTYKRELDEAERLGAKYVVFHVSEATLPQLFGAPCRYTDEQVAEANCQVINLLTNDKNYSFDFLMENLWWPGMSFRRPEIVRFMLDNVHYEGKGFMLDTGHLMNSNRELKSFDEAADFIFEVLRKQENILPYIKGVHLNGSLSGEYVKRLFENPPKMKENYWDRWCDTFSYVFNIDQHRPFESKRVKELIEYIAPEFLTHELISRSRQELGQLIDCQRKWLINRNGMNI